jgi:hypothetical protein
MKGPKPKQIKERIILHGPSSCPDADLTFRYATAKGRPDPEDAAIINAWKFNFQPCSGKKHKPNVYITN